MSVEEAISTVPWKIFTSISRLALRLVGVSTWPSSLYSLIGAIMLSNPLRSLWNYRSYGILRTRWSGQNCRADCRDLFEMEITHVVAEEFSLQSGTSIANRLPNGVQDSPDHDGLIDDTITDKSLCLDKIYEGLTIPIKRSAHHDWNVRRWAWSGLGLTVNIKKNVKLEDMYEPYLIRAALSCGPDRARMTARLMNTCYPYSFAARKRTKTRCA